MINVHVLEYPLLSNVAYWRLFRPIQVIRRLYPGVFNFQVLKKGMDFSHILNSDIIISPRPGQLPYVSEYILKAKKNGVSFIVDLDDDLLNLPRHHDIFHDYKEGEPAREEALKILDLADIFWYSTPKFLETYGKTYGKPGMVIPNAVLPGDLPNGPAPDRGVWTWRGRAAQIHDLIGAGWDWYEEIKEKPKLWVFLGFDPPLRHAVNTDSVRHISDPQEYFEKWKALGANGVWKPIINHPFNDHKSNIAWIEATIAGGVCLTNYAGKPGWELATDEFPDYKTACELWEKSKAEILENYNLIKTAQLRAQSMLQICSHLLPTSPDTANS
jgi:hypothetical protein